MSELTLVKVGVVEKTCFAAPNIGSSQDVYDLKATFAYL